IAFTDITEQAGVRDGYWGWGACAADFNNDGFIDLFHGNGFGYIPDDVAISDLTRSLQLEYSLTTSRFQGRSSRLFINNASGSFVEQAADWGIDAPSEGRGVACLDYERDGDIDLVVFDHSRRPQFFENRGGSGPGRRFMGIRLVGTSPNTDAIGARVFVTADVGHGRGVQTQLRLSEANSNFNSQNVPDLHFGLGEAAIVSQLRVVWPGGSELTCTDVPVNRFVVLDQRSPVCPGAPP
ncbi:MAG TPA: CRTAC1 family protein, partial [Steroidobacteraceae bacterium]|nr:CRTAC1 family protein [Steroidobacteraceae bacterium]